MTEIQEEIRLPASAESAGVARRHVRARLLEAGHEDWVDAAELAVSEVVTNGVLHAHTGLTVRISVTPAEALVEVEDGSHALPMQRASHDGADEAATTGRGLALLAAVTRRRGVRVTDSGKVIWFAVGDETAEADPDALLAAFGAAEWDVHDRGGPDESTTVMLLAMPATLWMAAREHHQALLRELVLYLAEHGDALHQQPDLTSADSARQLIWAALTEALDRDGRHDPAALSPTEPPASVDLEVHVPPDLVHAFGALQDALDLAEELAEHGLMLVRPGLPEVLAVRDWACEQVIAQLAGVPPSPWPGTAQERFTLMTHDRVTDAAPDWDSSVVTDSPRGVVAADDANRIIAVSHSLAAVTGWEPAELVGRRVIVLVPPALREAHVAGFSRHLTTGQTRVLGMPLELPVLHRDGHELPCSFLVEKADTRGRQVYLAWIEPRST